MVICPKLLPDVLGWNKFVSHFVFISSPKLDLSCDHLLPTLPCRLHCRQVSETFTYTPIDDANEHAVAQFINIDDVTEAVANGGLACGCSVQIPRLERKQMLAC